MIQKIHKEERVAILMVEQNARKALKVASRGYILELGKVVLEGSASDLSTNPKIGAAYLGGSTENSE
jgi:branched-chain amino acid transport system ATP-binding protein